MSDVTNAKKLVKLACDLTKAGFDVAADGKISIADFAIVEPVAIELFSNLSSFGPALTELKSLDAAGADALVAEAAADLVLPSARVQAIVKALLAFEAPIVGLIAATKVPA